MKRIFYNGKIYTLDKKNSVAEALYVEGNIIKKAGTKEEIMRYKNDGTTLTDLGGKTVVPGFNDSHMHLMVYGKSMNEVDLNGVKSVEEIIKRGQDFLKSMKLAPGQWLIGAGWNHELFEDKKMPTKEDLDQISKDIPIVFSRVCHHIDSCNTKALELGKITKDLVIEDGEIELVDGEVTGVLKENAVRYMRGFAPELSKEQKKSFIEKAVKKLTTYGITSIHSDDILDNDAYEILDIYKELEEEGKLDVRVYLQCRFKSPEELQEFIDSGYSPGTGSNNYKVGSLKLLADGSLGGRTAALYTSYEDDPGNFGILNITEGMLNKMIKTAHDNDMAVAIHGIGDKTIDMAIRGIAKAQEENPKKDIRHSIIHCQITTKEALDEMAKNNIAAFIQPIFIASDSKIAESRVGKVRAKYSYNWKTLLDKGVKLSFGTDCPIETPNPFENIYCAVNRCDIEGKPEGGWMPEENLTVEESVRAYTEISAWGSYEENIKGTIEEGKLADMAVLSEDIFTVPSMEIKDIECVMTIKDGVVVYKKGLS